jgi:hypothetical protein
MFTVIIFVHVISTGWSGRFNVDPKFPSFETCEAARPAAENGFKRYFEERHREEITIESKCNS